MKVSGGGGEKQNKHFTPPREAPEAFMESAPVHEGSLRPS